MRMHGVGCGRHHVQLTDLLTHIRRDELDGRLHFRHHTFGFLETLHTRFTEVFLLGNGADRLDMLLDIPSYQLAVATDPTLQVDKVVGVTDGANTLPDLLALPGKAAVLLTCCVHGLLDLLQTRYPLWGAARATLCCLVVGVVEVLMHPLARLFRLRGSLGSGPLFGGQR